MLLTIILIEIITIIIIIVVVLLVIIKIVVILVVIVVFVDVTVIFGEIGRLILSFLFLSLLIFSTVHKVPQEVDSSEQFVANRLLIRIILFVLFSEVAAAKRTVSRLKSVKYISYLQLFSDYL